MDIETLLGQLAGRFADWDGLRPERFERVGELVVAGSVVFCGPRAREYFIHGDVPHGRHPVYAGTVLRTNTETGRSRHWTTLLVLPFAEPERIAATADWEEGYDDYQPLDDYGCLWDEHAMQALLPAESFPAYPRLQSFLAKADADLADDRPADQIPCCTQETVDPQTGSNVLAFPVLSEAAGCAEARDEDGRLLCLVFTAG